jgi:GMP synthase-like glutamine amidotransferase
MVAHAAKARRAGRSQLSLKQSDLVIVSGGHMGAFEGHAWLPAKLPAGFNPGDIK